jgi:nucleoside-diphosphate-sugar epimerase
MLDTVVVTGAAGFIGHHLVRRLCEAGYEVRATDIRDKPAELADCAVSWLRCDLRDRNRVRDALDGASYVLHLASAHLEVHAPYATFESVNVNATADLVRASADAGVKRFIHTSSVGIYGNVADPPATEDSPKSPVNSYERTKLSGEETALSLARDVGLDLVVLRPSWVYGPGCRRTAKLVKALRQGRFFYVGSGENLRHPVFVGDLLEAYLVTLAAGQEVRRRAYNIAGPRYMPLREMVETFACVLGVKPPRLTVPKPIAWMAALGAELLLQPVQRDPPFSRRSLTFFLNDNAFDTTAAGRELEFTPNVDLEQGVRMTLETDRYGQL